jgi:hypothetical protein
MPKTFLSVFNKDTKDQEISQQEECRGKYRDLFSIGSGTQLLCYYHEAHGSRRLKLPQF